MQAVGTEAVGSLSPGSLVCAEAAECRVGHCGGPSGPGPLLRTQGTLSSITELPSADSAPDVPTCARHFDPLDAGGSSLPGGKAGRAGCVAFQVGLVVQNPPAKAGDLRDMGPAAGSGRSCGGGNGRPLHCSCLGNLMDRGAWPQSMGSRKSRTRPSNLARTPLSAEGTTGPLGAETQQKDTFVPCPHPAPVRGPASPGGNNRLLS